MPNPASNELSRKESLPRSSMGSRNDLNRKSSLSADNQEEPSPPKMPLTSKAFLLGPFVAYLAAFTDYFGLGMIIPLLPFFVEDAGNSEVWVGMILSLQYVGVIFGNNAIGFISDRVGRKFALLLSMAGDTAFFVASGYAKSSLMLLIFRVFAGAFTPLAPSLTWLLDSVDPSEHVFVTGIWSTFASVAFILATVLSGFIGDWQISMLVSGALAFVSFVHIAVAPQPGSLIPGRGPMAAPLPPKNVDRMLWSTEFKALSALSVGIGVVFGSFSALTPVILIDEFGFDQQGVAILMAVCAFLNTVAMRVGFTKVVAYFKHPALVAGNASVLQAVIMAVTPFALYNLYTYIAITVASTLAICYQLPSTTLMATLYADKYAQNARGTAVGTTRSFFSVGQAIGPYLSLVLYNVYQGLPFFVIAAIAFSTSLFAGYAHRVSKDIKFDDQEESLLQNEKEHSVTSTTAKGLPITRIVEAEDDLEGGK